MRKIYFGRRCFKPHSEQEYRAVCSRFREVEAAGGVVKDPAGRCLMIYRESRWDLPKGHRDKGESRLECALREVREETGAKDLKAAGLICVTSHCYYRHRKWHLKHTWWYEMTCPACELTPQSEEGINMAVWVEASEVAAKAAESFPSIQEVLHQLKLF